MRAAVGARRLTMPASRAMGARGRPSRSSELVADIDADAEDLRPIKSSATELSGSSQRSNRRVGPYGGRTSWIWLPSVSRQSQTGGGPFSTMRSRA